MLKIENLTKTYSGGITAVKNLSLSVEPGDIFGFIGHNGAGKRLPSKPLLAFCLLNKGK